MTIAAALHAAGSWAAASVAAQDAAATDWGREQALEFFGRLHPLLLHLPIGLFAAAALFELGSLVREQKLGGVRRFLYVLVALSAAAAATSGWLLGSGDDYAGALVDDHRKLGIATAAVLVVVALLDLVARSGGAAFVRRMLCAAAAVLLVLAGHDGGSITHGPGYLEESAPPWLADLLQRVDGEAAEAALEVQAEDGAAEIATLASMTGTNADAALVLDAMGARCFSCHGPSKRKGGLRLDEVDGLLSTLEPGDAAASEIVRRLTLPREDDEAMPPSGAPLGPDVVAALERWIDAGAPLGSVEGELAAFQAAQAEAVAALEAVRAESGARVEPIASDLDVAAASQRLVVDWSHSLVTPERARLAALAAVAPRVHELRLAATDVSDAELEALPPLPGLRRAHLERTAVGDAGAAALVERAPGLAYLNLHSTAVTSALLQRLEGLQDLERLVLFDTAVEPADLVPLAAALPDLRATPAATEATPALPQDDPFGERQPRRILAADASKGRIALLREVAIGEPELLWEHEIRQIHDLQWLGPTSGPHGRVLFQETWTRLVEVDTATDETLWSYDAAANGEGPVEVHSFRRLEDGTTMVAESGRARIVLVAPDGSVEHVIALQVDDPHVHHDTRLVRPTSDGTFLVAHERDGVAREYDREGNVVWEYRVPLFAKERAPGHGPGGHGNQLFAAVRLDDGDTLITTGNGSSLLRVRPNGSLRWHLGQDDLDDVTLAWTTTVQQLSSGNLVLGNCHAGPDEPQLVELTPEGERVWSFRDFDRFGNSLSNSFVVEESR